MDAGLAFLDTVPGFLPWDNGDCSCLSSWLAKTVDNGSGMMTETSSLDVGISQLTQLSSQLASLHRWSCAVANNTESPFQFSEPSQERQICLINDVAFKSVASWLVHVSADVNFFPCTNPKTSTLEQSSTDDILSNVFTASYQFMETLRGLQDEEPSKVQTSISDCHGGTSRDSWTSTSSASSFTQDMHPSIAQRSENLYSSIIERHL
ncbi:hypothetical protein BDV29DRAFT_65865 [Aspergillus leporis]|uniref:Uncharacterized protein n=1 Tax=Aspergillus leporis TaxID=41062 RepID=A0A5N5WK05_9EURO|nr:hypothetical protein BDV29DRAFT_65865 [Aspergillus leporis]